jgi:hypothetical protein
VASSTQDHVSEVGSGETTREVSYAYDTSDTDDVYTNGLRQKSVTYPGGRVVHETYGLPDGVADRLHRVDMLEADSGGSPGTDLAQYQYNGLGRLATVDYPVPDLKLSKEKGSGLNGIKLVRNSLADQSLR